MTTSIGRKSREARLPDGSLTGPSAEGTETDRWIHFIPASSSEIFPIVNPSPGQHPIIYRGLEKRKVENEPGKRKVVRHLARNAMAMRTPHFLSRKIESSGLLLRICFFNPAAPSPRTPRVGGCRGERASFRKIESQVPVAVEHSAGCPQFQPGLDTLSALGIIRSSDRGATAPSPALYIPDGKTELLSACHLATGRRSALP